MAFKTINHTEMEDSKKLVKYRFMKSHSDLYNILGTNSLGYFSNILDNRKPIEASGIFHNATILDGELVYKDYTGKYTIPCIPELTPLYIKPSIFIIKKNIIDTNDDFKYYSLELINSFLKNFTPIEEDVFSYYKNNSNYLDNIGSKKILYTITIIPLDSFKDGIFRLGSIIFYRDIKSLIKTNILNKQKLTFNGKNQLDLYYKISLKFKEGVTGKTIIDLCGHEHECRLGGDDNSISNDVDKYIYYYDIDTDSYNLLDIVKNDDSKFSSKDIAKALNNEAVTYALEQSILEFTNDSKLVKGDIKSSDFIGKFVSNLSAQLVKIIK